MGREDQVVSENKVQLARLDGVLVLRIDNPPSGALSSDVRQELMDALVSAVEDTDVHGIVIAGSDTTFATGAGVTEKADTGAPDLATLCDFIEAMEMPVAVAIQGAALGGGLELALAAHLRIAAADARLGAPEITLGLVPNAGGTQRLPKVVGGVAALKMLLSGRAVSGEAAHKLGLVDALAKGDVTEAAVAHVSHLIQSEGELRRSSTRRDRLGEGTAFLEAVAAHRKMAHASPLEAPARMIECVESALLLPFEIGRGMEQAAYDDLVASEDSKSLRHIFAAERHLQAASRWEGRVPSRPLGSVAVIGARGIGAEISVLCLDAGFDVVVAEESDEALEFGSSRIIGHYDARVASGNMTEEAVEQILDRMQAVSGYATIGDCDVVIDASPDLTTRRVAALDAAMKAGAVLIVAGEGVELARVADMTERPSDVVGARFFPGVRKNRMVELVATDETGPKAVATARGLMRKLDRLIVSTGPGRFAVGTSLMEALHAAADLCLEDGARIAQIDMALRDWGLPFGSFAMRDILGLRRVSGPRGLEGQRGGGLDEVLIAMGRLGLVSGAGYYVYKQAGKPGVEDPEVTQMVDADRAEKRIRPRTLSDGEIKMRCVAAMAGAGARLLADGIARRPADIDMVAVHGLGFARRTGGVMFAADLMDLARTRQLLLDMSQVTPRIPAPSTIFQDLIKAGQDFSDLNS